MVVEGPKNSYPNYKENQVTITSDDPAVCDFADTFICSPLFSLNAEGADIIPNLNDGTTITFVMVPNIFPGFFEINTLSTSKNQLWFSIGLANLVIFEENNNTDVSQQIIDLLRSQNNITAAEQWSITNSKIADHRSLFQKVNGDVYHCSLSISDKLPLNLKFAVSEYIISIDKFLTASKRFTPHYFESHKKTITISNQILISDLCFLNGDKFFVPSDSIIKSLQAKTVDEAFENLDKQAFREKKEELVNDRHGRLIQFNSSLSYLYSQAYSGTFPLFDHNGLVRRHSLLGIGSAISALYELVCQIEEAFASLPFDDFRKTPFQKAEVPKQYYSIFSDPSGYSSELLKKDNVIDQIHDQTAQLVKANEGQGVPKDYYNRLAFFSGRLGFREHDFSATAAIQVLVEAHCMEWHVINYTHEIIHNHVRIILTSNLINIPRSLRGVDYITWLTESMAMIAKIQKGDHSQNLTYQKFFTAALLNYCINAHYFGSLSRESNHQLISEKRAEFSQPTSHQLKHVVKAVYRDINEIFVHVIDFSYIYKKDLKAYILSIWASWSTVPSVTSDIKQYIVRSLIIVGLTRRGNTQERFEQAKLYLLSILPKLTQRKSVFVFDQIQELLEDKKDSDLEYRFSNCIIIADMVYNFFVGNIESLLENHDKNLTGLATTEESEEDEEIQVYDAEPNEFTKIEIKSKTVFLLDQLLRQVRSEIGEEKQDDESKERQSSWLLLSLSSYNLQ